ncbi:MAG TPA: hypothetical protein VGJ25_16285 [Gaiellaceae bacterium]|jgi:hypothetical protein
MSSPRPPFPGFPFPLPPASPGQAPPPAFQIPPELYGLIAAVLLALMERLHPTTAPPSPAPSPPAPPPAPPSPPIIAGPKRRILGGRGRITGATKDGPLGPRIPREKLDRILAGEVPGPNDTRLEFDITPQDQNAVDFGPHDPSWQTDRQPHAPGATEPIRLHFTVVGDGDADLVHENANSGCNPRIRVRVPRGSVVKLVDIYADCPDYGDGEPPAIIPILAGPISFGE